MIFDDQVTQSTTSSAFPQFFSLDKFSLFNVFVIDIFDRNPNHALINVISNNIVIMNVFFHGEEKKPAKRNQFLELKMGFPII